VSSGSTFSVPARSRRAPSHRRSSAQHQPRPPAPLASARSAMSSADPTRQSTRFAPPDPDRVRRCRRVPPTPSPITMTKTLRPPTDIQADKTRGPKSPVDKDFCGGCAQIPCRMHSEAHAGDAQIRRTARRARRRARAVLLYRGHNPANSRTLAVRGSSTSRYTPSSPSRRSVRAAVKHRCRNSS
jgi:hypothetical protein